ncbi:AraC family transcriptional regulator [Pseudomonas borbori]
MAIAMPAFNSAADLIPVAHAVALIELAEELGLPRARLFADAHVYADVTEAPRGRLSFLDFYSLANCALLQCGQPALGLLFGQRLNVSAHGILGYAVLSSSNLGMAIQFALKYYPVLGLTFELEMVEQDDRVELRATESMPLGALSRFAAESLLSSLYTIARFLLGEPLQHVQVGFTHVAPAYAAQYQQVFGVAARFEQPYHCLSLPKAYLARPMALANPATMHMCQQQCEALLSGLDLQDGLLTRLRRLLMANPGEFPSLQDAADALHTSGRSLRRQLANMGTSYQQVLDEVRRSLAVQYLTATHLPLYEIAYLLGFNDPSNFRRAFKKWTGKLPTDFRPEEPS